MTARDGRGNNWARTNPRKSKKLYSSGVFKRSGVSLFMNNIATREKMATSDNAVGQNWPNPEKNGIKIMRKIRLLTIHNHSIDQSNLSADLTAVFIKAASYKFFIVGCIAVINTFIFPTIERGT